MAIKIQNATCPGACGGKPNVLTTRPMQPPEYDPGNCEQCQGHSQSYFSTRKTPKYQASGSLTTSRGSAISTMPFRGGPSATSFVVDTNETELTIPFGS
jgi:hypothetical protein